MRYLITGGSGYIGGRLTEILVGRDETELVVNLDVRPPTVPWPKVEFVQGDVRDRALILGLLADREVDAIVHLAFVLNPIHDEARMYDIDVNGTAAVLAAATEAGTSQVLVTSSATAYGAWPDNPRPIAEDQPVRGVPDFSYARDKAEADRLCQLWAAEHPDRVMTIVRPCIVFGPNVDNYIVRSFETSPYMPILDGVDEEVQYVHEDDIVTALIGLLDARAPGAFNVAGDGTMTWGECARLIGSKTREISFRTQYRIYNLLWRLHFPRVGSPAGNLHFIRHHWLVSTEKLKATTGWAPRHTTRETFELTMRAKGLLEASPAPVATEPIAS
jgi:UDP-glucose 4-epimerase